MSTVLAIAGNPDDLHLIEAMMARRPALTLLTVLQGSLGLELARGHRPDLIVVDLDLPDMAGEDLLRRLHADERTHETPVLVLSDDASERHVERLLAAGAQAHLAKPLDVGRALALVDAAVRGKPKQPAAPQESGRTDPLVVSPQMRRLVEGLVQDLGWSVPSDLTPEAADQLLDQAGEQLDRLFVEACCQALPPDQVDGFLALVQQRTPLRERLVYLQECIPNTMAVFDAVLTQFRERWRAVSTEAHQRAS